MAESRQPFEWLKEYEEMALDFGAIELRLLARYDPRQVEVAMELLKQEVVKSAAGFRGPAPEWLTLHFGAAGQLPPFKGPTWDALTVKQGPPNKGAKTDKHQTQGKSRGEKAWLRRNR